MCAGEEHDAKQRHPPLSQYKSSMTPYVISSANQSYIPIQVSTYRLPCYKFKSMKVQYTTKSGCFFPQRVTLWSSDKYLLCVPKRTIVADDRLSTSKEDRVCLAAELGKTLISTLR